jgi:hypothetical protein
VTGAELVDELAGAFRAAGLRVALDQDDLIPPCYWLAAEGLEPRGTLTVPLTAMFYVYWLPVRGLGVGSTARNVQAMLDAAVALFDVADVGEWRSVQLVLDPTGPWLAYRAPVTVVAS